jgi:hypothetical protein
MIQVHRCPPGANEILIASSVVTVIGYSAICVNVLVEMRRGEEELARQTLENVAATINADISRNVELYDRSLRAAASNMVLPDFKDLSKPIRQLILFDHATTARHFGAIQVFDAKAQLFADAATLDPIPENRSDEEFFLIHRAQPDAGLFISRRRRASAMRSPDFRERSRVEYWVIDGLHHCCSSVTTTEAVRRDKRQAFVQRSAA